MWFRRGTRCARTERNVGNFRVATSSNNLQPLYEQSLFSWSSRSSLTFRKHMRTISNVMPMTSDLSNDLTFTTGARSRG